MEGNVIVVDEDGNIVPQPRFVFGSNVTIPARGTAYFEKDCRYNGGYMDFSVDIASGDVEYLTVKIWSPKNSAEWFGEFEANGSRLRGTFSQRIDNVWLTQPGRYYNYKIYNGLGKSVKVNTFEGFN